MSQQNVLKRSHKTEFSRERSFVKQSLKDANNKRRSQTFNKPSMEIYRPPNTRSDNNNTPQLNVHAKEFTMLQQQQQQHHHDLQTSKSSGHLSHHILSNNSHSSGSHGYYDPNNMSPQSQQHNSLLSHSKSSGNILRHHHHHHPIAALHHPSLILPALPIGLVHSNSTSTILQHHHNMAAAHQQQQQHSPRIVNFGDSMLQYQQSPPAPINLYSNGFLQQAPTTTTQLLLRRSKSFTAADNNNAALAARSNSNSVQSALAKLKSLAVKEEELDLVEYFPTEDRESLKQAMEDPAQLPSRTLMDLVKVILERVVEGIKYSDAGAKICLAIIEREKNQTFIESLLNTCQQWYQERDKILRGIKSGEGTRFTAFMWFLTEMCGQLKRRQLASNFESLQPDLVLLSVLAKSCQACVSLPIRCLPETECLFFVLTSIGRDLEKELPAQLEQLLANVRDGFLASVGSPAVRKTLLQLIELHASNWQLPGSSVLYYYPRIQ